MSVIASGVSSGISYCVSYCVRSTNDSIIDYNTMTDVIIDSMRQMRDQSVYLSQHVSLFLPDKVER